MLATAVLNPFDAAPGVQARARAPRPVANTGRVVIQWALHPFQTYQGELADRESKQQAIKNVVRQRLSALIADAARENEPTSQYSLSDLQAFLTQFELASRPSVFLLDNGNFRAVWNGADKQQVGLQFLGGGVLQFVIFAKRPAPLNMSRTAGREIIANIRSVLHGAAAEKLVFA